MKDNYNFSKGKRGAINKPTTNKERISIRFDSKIVEWFRKKVEGKNGGSYQALMNKVLLEYVERDGASLETILQRVINNEFSNIYKRVLAERLDNRKDEHDPSFPNKPHPHKPQRSAGA